MSTDWEKKVVLPDIEPSPETVAAPKTPDPDGPGKAVLVCVAWPYANGHLHLGHIAGSLLPPDIFARYHRMAGNRVLMVSGSDCHGTPILLTAEKENKSPGEVVGHYNKEHIQALKGFGIAFDLFTATTTDNHREHVQDIFLALLDRDYLDKRTTDAPFDTKSQRFLPDRYVEGTCPHCGYEEARGDQCDNCGKTLDPHELIDPHSKQNPGTPIEFRATEHFFFKLPKLEARLKEYVSDKRHWRANTINFTNNWLKEGLKDRPITRDLTWGIPIPLEGYEGKCLYVWFEAVCGYLTASIEWSILNGKPDAWKKWWEDPEAKSYYFLGKDNIPFHTIIWPAILMGYSEGRATKSLPPLNLPYDVPANEFLNLDGKQFSKSRGIGIWVPDILGRFDPDVVRYYLSINMPEQKDANWTWEDFVAKVNDELVDTFGNLAHRALTFTEKHFGAVPEAGALSDADQELLAKIEATHAQVTEDLEACRFKKALRGIMTLAGDGNRYFDAQAPWRLLKEDQERAATVLNTSLRLVRALDLMLAPFVPFATERLWRSLGQDGSIHEASWGLALQPLPAGTPIQQPEVLFKKALRGIMTLAGDGNRYFDAQAPWRLLKEDQERAATVLNTSLRLVRALDLMLAPFVPFATERLWRSLGQDGSIHEASWGLALEPLPAGTPLQQPQVLFKKLDLDEILRPAGTTDDQKPQKQETKKMPEATTETQEITIDDFAKMDLRIARIKSVEDHPNADKLYVIKLDVGELGERQVCAGLKSAYKPDDMVGRQVAFIANLKPAKLRGVESQGMILAGEGGGVIGFLTPEREVPAGSKVR